MSCEGRLKLLAGQCWKKYYEVEIIWKSCPNKVGRIAGRLQKEGKFDIKELTRLHIQFLEHLINFYSVLIQCIRAVHAGSEAAEQICHSAMKALIPCMETVIKFFECLKPIADELKKYKGKCDVEDLKPLTSKLAIKMDKGTKVIWDNVDKDLIKAKEKFDQIVTRECKGKIQVTSAFRPQEYQDHLYEVGQKYVILVLGEDECPECQTLKKKVKEEFEKHELIIKVDKRTGRKRAAVARISNHTNGRAVDISVELPEKCGKTVDELAEKAGLYRPDPKGDPVHYRLKGTRR